MQFQQDWPKDKNYSSFNFFAENFEKFRSTELYGAPLEGSTIFLKRISSCRMSMESYRLAELKYAIFSRTGRKTKKLQHSELFLWTFFKHGLLKGLTSLLQYSSMTRAPLESSQLTQLIDSFPLAYGMRRCALEKLSILLEAHHKAQSSEIFQSFQQKN